MMSFPRPSKASWHRVVARVLAFAAIMSFLPGARANVDEAEVDRRAQEIIRTTMSPFCPGRTLDSCPSPNAADWRDDVRKWVAEGVPTPEIRERLTRRVPDVDITGAPSTALDAVLPILLTVLAVLLLALLLRRLLTRRGAGSGEDPEPEKRADLDGKLDEELSRLDE